MVKPGYKQTEIGVIPEDWETPTLDNVCVFNPTSDQTIPAEFIYVDLESVSKGNLVNKRFVSRELAPSRAQRLFEKNDILYQTVRPYQKNNLLVNFDSKLYVASTGYAVIRSIPNKSIPEYVYHYLYSDAFVSIVLDNCTGSSYPAINPAILAKLRISIPSDTTEQKIIADALSGLDNAISVLEKLIAKKKAIKQGAMQELLTGKKRLPGFSEEWKEKPIGFFGIFVSGDGFPIKYQGSPSGQLPFYKVSDFNNERNHRVMDKANNYISKSLATMLSCKIIPENSVVFAKIGAAISLERKRVTGCKCCIDNNMMSFQPYQKDIASYMCYLFQTIRFGDLVEATALPSLSGKTIGQIRRAFPPTIEEQIAIATVLTNMDSEIEALEQKLAKFRQVKQGMMQQLLTGKIRLV